MQFLKVEANVRYWEDATINGASSESGENVPFKNGGCWEPIIDLEKGRIIIWPEGTTAQIHFKVCDAGEYFLTDSGGNKTHKYNGCYVPNEYLCHGDNGHGDYIILNVAENGRILGYIKPEFDPDHWDKI